MLDNKKFRLSPEIFHQSIIPDSHSEDDGNVEHLSSEPMEHENYMDKLRSEAELIIQEAAFAAKEKEEQALADSERMISEAMDRVAEIEREAREKGYQEGFETGYTEGVEASQGLIDDAVTFKTDALAQYDAILRGAESDLIEMVTMAIEKIIGERMDQEPLYIEGIIRKGIETCTFRESMVIRLSPEDIDVAEQVRVRLVTQFEKIDDLQFKADPALSKGSCVIDTQSGSVESSVNLQVDKLKQILEDLLQSE